MNDEFNRKRKRALEILKNTYINERKYLPPAYPFLWRLGFNLPPPHFMSFLGVMIFTGLPYGMCSLGLALMMHETTNISIAAVALVFILATVFFGVSNALYYNYGRIMHRMAKWKDL